MAGAPRKGSRSTFRKPAGEVAWQRQLRDRYEDEPPPPVELDLSAARVRPVSRSIAKSIILKYEWLGTMATTSLHYGIFFGIYCAGVTCVAVRGSGTAGINRTKTFGIEPADLCTLARGACVHWAPTGTNSKLVAWTTRLLSKARAGKLIVAYADPDAGEIGTIYQACGWDYLGTTIGAPTEIVSPQGRVINVRTVGSYAKRARMRYSKMEAALRARGWETQRSSRKGIYARILDPSDRDLVRRINSMRLPYPKRERPSP